MQTPNVPDGIGMRYVAEPFLKESEIEKPETPYGAKISKMTDAGLNFTGKSLNMPMDMKFSDHTVPMEIMNILHQLTPEELVNIQITLLIAKKRKCIILFAAIRTLLDWHILTVVLLSLLLLSFVKKLK